MSDSKPPHRTSSYARLKAKLIRNPSDIGHKKDWKRPDTPEAIVRHALHGGARAFLLAYGVRAGVNFCLYLLRVARKRAPLANILHASFQSLDALRFGAMFGSFSLLWKLINNGMRHYRGKEDRFNGMVAGSIAGLSILFEKKERRVDIAQQFFVRALQALYNAGKERDIVNFKNGDALLFALTSAQVLYAYTMQPQTLPPDFYSFMLKAARVPKDLLELNNLNVRGVPLDTLAVVDAVQKFRPTAHALKIAQTIPPYPPVLPCECIHPWVDGCNKTAIERFSKVFKSMLPVYGTLHFVPMLLLRTEHLKRDPVKLLSKTTVATMKSGAFLASFVMLYQYQICGHRNLVKAGLTTFNSKYLYWLAGFICSYISIFFEDKRRRTELALYVLPKALKSFYEICYQRKWIIRIKHFEVAMASFAMGVIMSFYQDEPDVLSGFVRKVMYQFFQKN
ncbi:hypothetical protein K450DRAFT_228052 [Umbelopsis ramanniana AG]|uniref:Transmembrane protein 135 N-terminal domain-containing protein n=1 Tax=Umbelopsis ramanniana AG TaxID=1314678 RepID=A0AAD5EFU0_UMBRA|nr:uncharacterized protein K450DRAFT_228052 [Umbelopsis ramanniana AG]KAI8582245.1 hypothetical protein K450DRAFT_228052 [Umbelopsis ramanniana AG]